MLKGLPSVLKKTYISKHTDPKIRVSNGTAQTNLRTVTGHFKSLSRINTVPVPLALKKFRFKSTFMYCPQRQLKMFDVFFLNNRLQLLESVLFHTALVSTTFCLLYFLCKKDPV